MQSFNKKKSWIVGVIIVILTVGIFGFTYSNKTANENRQTIAVITPVFHEMQYLKSHLKNRKEYTFYGRYYTSDKNNIL